MSQFSGQTDLAGVCWDAEAVRVCLGIVSFCSSSFFAAIASLWFVFLRLLLVFDMLLSLFVPLHNLPIGGLLFTGLQASLLHLAAVNAADKDAARKTAFRRPAIDLSQPLLHLNVPTPTHTPLYFPLQTPSEDYLNRWRLKLPRLYRALISHSSSLRRDWPVHASATPPPHPPVPLALIGEGP